MVFGRRLTVSGKVRTASMSLPTGKRILIVLYYYHPYVSGLSLLAKMEAEGLAARGHSVTVLTTRYRDDLAPEEALNGVKVVRAKVLGRASKGVISWDLVRKIITLAKTHDVVNPHLPMAHFGLALPFLDKGKILPQYHCDLNLGEGLTARFLMGIAYWSMHRTLKCSSRIIVTTTDYFANCRFAEFLPKACEIYPPVDRKRFGRRDPGVLRKRLGIEGHPYLVGFVGRVVAEKGLEHLLRAIPLLEKELGDFKMLVAGDYENIAGGSVKSMIDPLVRNFPGRVMFLGRLGFEDLVSFYNLIDVLALPSTDPLEAFGMVQVEAVSCGTPVIASNLPGVREVVRRTSAGKLVTAGDHEDIAEKIIDLFHCPIEVDESRLSVFNYEASIGKYETLFSKVKS